MVHETLARSIACPWLVGLCSSSGVTGMFRGLLSSTLHLESWNQNEPNDMFQKGKRTKSTTLTSLRQSGDAGRALWPRLGMPVSPIRTLSPMLTARLPGQLLAHVPGEQQMVPGAPRSCRPCGTPGRVHLLAFTRQECICLRHLDGASAMQNIVKWRKIYTSESWGLKNLP